MAAVEVSEEYDEISSSTYTSILPAATIDKVIRKRFGGKRVSATTARYTAAALEHIFSELTRVAGEEAAGDKKMRIKATHLIKATRSHPGLSRFFRQYMFAPRTRVDYKSSNLLPPKERAQVLKERIEKKNMKRDAVVPAVDEE